MLRDALGIPVLVVSAVLLAAAGQAQEAETGAAATMGGSPPTGSVIFTQNLDEAPSDAGQLQQIYQQGLSGGWGGAYGYYVKQVGGSVLLAFNEGYVYDPASALKTLILAYATRQVSTGAEILTSPVTVYTYPHSRNAGGDPANKDLCPDLADEVPANASSSDLQSVLKGMMQASNNRYTRALELRYGRTALAAYASSLGMSSTRLNQIFGCGWDGDQRNEWTLTDAGRLYEAIDTGSAVPSSARASVLGPMLTTPIDYYGSVVQAEAATLGIADAVSEFVADVSGRQKGGSYNICIGSCASNTTVIRDEAGLLTLPVQSPKGVVPTDFVWGSFIVNERTSCSGFPCATAEQAGNAVRASLPELFRPTIHAALQT